MVEITALSPSGDGAASGYTRGEEILNSTTHGLGALLAAAACALLIAKAAGYGDATRLAAASVFGTSLVAEYLLSTLYHAVMQRSVKLIFKVLDHCGIYLLIAGSYTPYCLVTLDPAVGHVLLAFIWLVAVAGMAAEAFWTLRPKWISAAVYLAMGWCVAAFLPALSDGLGPSGFALQGKPARQHGGRGRGLPLP